MEQNDVVVEAFGATVGVRFDGSVPATAVAEFRRTWARCLIAENRRSDELPQRWVHAALAADPFYDRDAKLVSAASEHELHELLTSEITRTGISLRAGGPLLFHAAAAEISPGCVHGFVAASGTGKTTLARAIGSAFGYVTDETLVVDPADLSVEPYPKPLCVIVDQRAARAPGSGGADVPARTTDSGLRPKDVIGAEDLGLRHLTGAPLRLTGLHFLHRADGHGVEFESISTVEAMMRLAAQTSALSSYKHPLSTLRTVIDSCPVIDIARYGEADELVARLGELYAG